jgi:hypothetical protein
VANKLRRLCVTCGVMREWCRKRGCHRRHCRCEGQRCPKALPEYRITNFPGSPGVIVDVRGRHTPMMMSLGRARQRRGAQKGGETTAARGTGYRWDAERARKAAQKRWKHVRRVRGRAIGLKQATRARTDRAALRAYYAADFGAVTDAYDGTIYFDQTIKKWYRSMGGSWHLLSERQALVRLGHLRRTARPVITHIWLKTDGTKRAPKE